MDVRRFSFVDILAGHFCLGRSGLVPSFLAAFSFFFSSVPLMGNRYHIKDAVDLWSL